MTVILFASFKLTSLIREKCRGRLWRSSTKLQVQMPSQLPARKYLSLSIAVRPLRVHRGVSRAVTQRFTGHHPVGALPRTQLKRTGIPILDPQIKCESVLLIELK